MLEVEQVMRKLSNICGAPKRVVVERPDVYNTNIPEVIVEITIDSLRMIIKTFLSFTNNAD